MDIVMCYGDTFTCLPIYTHNGNGLDFKNFMEDYVSIRDAADEIFALPAEGPHQRLWADKSPDLQALFISGRSCVKISESCTYRYDALKTIEG